MHLDELFGEQILLSQPAGGGEVVSDEPLPPGPAPRSDHAMVITDRSTLFVFGGFDADRRTLMGLWKYDLGFNSWAEQSTAGQVAPVPRCWHTMVANDKGSRLYIFGGYDMTNDLNDLWRFNVAQGKWDKLTPTTVAPLPRDRHSMVYHKDKLVVFGGYVGTYVNDLWIYSIVDGSWVELTTATSPPKRRSHGATSSETKMYIFGGFNGDKYFSDLWELDFTKSIWTEIRTPARPAKRARAHLVADNVGRLYVFGGHDGNKFKSDLWRHVNGDGWTKLSPEYDQPTERADGVMVYYSSRVSTEQGRIYMFGGIDSQARRNDLFKYEISSNQWRELFAL